ncbi:uncharacterized protein LOC135376191 [Ornithodoros turicata]|uniref:uncharacterized protein LOC135376191 n=1 Tax=Ornithodoros turicata TaxID=34597 RepID=UPI003138A34C
MSVLKRQEWICRTCRTHDARSGDVVSGSQPSTASSSGTGDIKDSIDKLMCELLSVKATVNQIPLLSQKVEDLAALKPVVESLLPIKDAIDELKNSITFVSNMYDEVRANVNKNADDINETTKRVTVLEDTVEKQAEEIQKLLTLQNDSEQHNRNLNLELHGIPVQEGENLRDIVRNLASKASISDFKPEAVQHIHRLPVKGGKIPPILVRFTSLEARNALLQKRKMIRMLSENRDLPDNLYVNENLTGFNRDLLWKAKQRAKEQAYRFVWTKNGKIYVRKVERDPVLRITGHKDLAKIV